MPHNLSPFNFQFSPPAARHYHSDLSIWLSVDPMADKYPGLSPYVYCANNPVRLVDPDGRTWEEEKDEARSNTLIARAQRQININNRAIKRYQRKGERLESKGKPDAHQYDDFIQDLKEENRFLEEGIQNLRDMGLSETQKYHFQLSDMPEGSTCYVQKTENGTINIIADIKDIGSQWHECVHIGQLLKMQYASFFDENGILCTKSSEKNSYGYGVNRWNSESDAYKSEYSFMHSDSQKFFGVGTIRDIDDVFILKQLSK